MIDKLESAIEALAVKSEQATTALEALQYSQSALNLAHVIATVKNLPVEKN